MGERTRFAVYGIATDLCRLRTAVAACAMFSLSLPLVSSCISATCWNGEKTCVPLPSPAAQAPFTSAIFELNLLLDISGACGTLRHAAAAALCACARETHLRIVGVAAGNDAARWQYAGGIARRLLPLAGAERACLLSVAAQVSLRRVALHRTLFCLGDDGQRRRYSLFSWLRMPTLPLQRFAAFYRLPLPLAYTNLICGAATLGFRWRCFSKAMAA